MTQSVEGNLLTPKGWLRGRITWSGEVISSVAGRPVEKSNLAGERIVPGYVDLHVHGGGGHDFMGGCSSVAGAARFHASRGTTALVPTLISAPAETMRESLAQIALAHGRGEPGPELLGAHLEGPFISRKRLGAQPDSTMLPDAALVRELAREYPVRIITVAPELPGSLKVIKELASEGIRVQIGHTDASCAVAVRALQAGAKGFTHLFNAMSPFAHRGGGVVLCALAYSSSAEIICDNRHVEAAAICVARRAIPGLYAVSDANPAAGMPDGGYQLGGRETVKRGGSIYLADGKTLAGSAMTLHDMRANLLAIGLDELEVAEMLSSRPAACLGLGNARGTLTEGKIADLVVLDEGGEIMEVYVRGQAFQLHD